LRNDNLSGMSNNLAIYVGYYLGTEWLVDIGEEGEKGEDIQRKI
jgi:hypothetical protein